MLIVTRTVVVAGMTMTLLLNEVSVAKDIQATGGGGGDGIVSIPLVPHHVVQQRRRGLDVAALDAVFRAHQALQPQQRERPTHSKRYYNDLNRHLRSTTSATATTNATAAVFENEEEIAVGLYQGYGTHYADLWCGTPPQRQTVIVDTGSSVTAFPCTGCGGGGSTSNNNSNSCGVPDYHTDLLFDKQASRTFQTVPCTNCTSYDGSYCEPTANSCAIGVSYQEGSSWTAYVALDTCYVGAPQYNRTVFNDNGPNAPPYNNNSSNNPLDPNRAPALAFDIHFGCQTSITGFFETQLEDGIMGMDTTTSTFWYQMYQAGKIDRRAFSLCFSRYDGEISRTGTEAGAMNLGGTDKRLHLTPMVYSATRQLSSFYEVHVRKVYLRPGTQAAASSSKNNATTVQLNVSEYELNAGGIIVDSGTTDSYFSSFLAGPFGQVFQELTGQPYDQSVKMFTSKQLSQQPTILMQLAGDIKANQAVLNHSSTGFVAGLAGELDPNHPLDVILAIPPERYYEFDLVSKGYIARIYFDEYSGGVIGANSMLGHDVYFDNDALHLGWAESTCNYTSLLLLSGHGISNDTNTSPTPSHTNNNSQIFPPRSPTMAQPNTPLSALRPVNILNPTLSAPQQPRTATSSSSSSAMPGWVDSGAWVTTVTTFALAAELVRWQWSIL